jgi:glycosyltransferase involved in cell wall biosynthesis
MKVGFVVQRYGLEVCGGAELLCRQVAEHMAKYWDIEVLTTCARDYTTWANFYPAGEERINGIPVLRYPVTEWRTDCPDEFAHLCTQVTRPGHTREEELRWMRLLGPWAPGLFDALRERRTAYDLFIFFTYLYCSTYHGLLEVKDRALLIPTAHDEAYLRVSIFEELFNAPRGLVFLTPEERDLVHRRFRNHHLPSDIVGVGVEAPERPNPQRFRQRHGISGPFIAYMGRVDPAKGCDRLLAHFLCLRSQRREELSLVLMGQQVMDLPDDGAIRTLGFVSDEDKFDGLAAAEFVINPSQFESLSMVVLEAWSVGRPVLVNGLCEVLTGQCRRAQGGLWYTNEAEFCAAADYLLANREASRRLGENGRKYLQANYAWPVIEEKYRRLADRLLGIAVERA